MASELRVWVGCLACYNAGRLVGEWFPAEDASALTPADVHGYGPCDHEELWVFDHEGFPAGTGEMSPMEATRIAEALELFEGIPMAAIGAYASNAGVGLADVDPEDFRDSFAGEWDSELDYVYELAGDLGLFTDRHGVAVDDLLSRYFDYDAFARDLFMGDYWSAPAPDGGVFVFRSI